LLLNPYFSQYVHTSYKLCIPAYSAIGLPSELPLCLPKNTTLSSHIKLTPLRHLCNKCTKTIIAVVSPYTTSNVIIIIHLYSKIIISGDVSAIYGCDSSQVFFASFNNRESPFNLLIKSVIISI